MMFPSKRHSVATRFFTALLFALPLIGCIVQEELHYRVSPTLENPRELKLGGMVTDQLLGLWEQADQDSAATLEILRDATNDSPIVFDNPLLIEKSMQELWVEAIQPSKQASFRAALRAVSLRVSDRALCIRLSGTIRNRRAAYWTWCPRDFLGEPVKHVDTLENELPKIVVASDRAKLAFADTNATFVPYGFDGGPTERFEPRAETDWEQLTGDYAEMKRIGANCVRVHLQVGNFMDSPTKPNVEALNRLRRLIRLAENEGLYLNITGLACYQEEVIPVWYDRLSEQRRWNTQAAFWAAVARTCATSNAVFAYDLINEPVLGGADSPVSPWLISDGFIANGRRYFFVQKLVRDLRGRDPNDVSKAWVDKMVSAIRKHDPRTLCTVGVIPWPIAFGAGEPSFYNNGVDENLDFVSVHVYPADKDADPAEMDSLMENFAKYDFGKPVLVQETSSFGSNNEIWGEFLDRSTAVADGWITQYFGDVPNEFPVGDGFLDIKSILDFWLSKQPELVSAAL